MSTDICIIMELVANDILIKPASTLCVCGPSKSGKTCFVFNLIKHSSDMFKNGESPKKILFCYSIQQPMYDEIQRMCGDKIEFFEGVPEISKIQEFADGDHNLIVLDDMMHQVVKAENMENLFTLGSHHLHLSVIFISQNLFQQGKHARTIALNTEYYILYKNPRGSGQINTLSKQLGKSLGGTLKSAYNDAVNITPYGYVFLDMTQHCPDNYRIRSGILPGEQTVIYKPLKGLH